MPRKSGSSNVNEYKYRVNNGSEIKYYISQKEIQDDFDLKRTAIYYMIHSPDKRKDHRGIIIEKLEEPLPVYKIHDDFDDGLRVIKYEKIIY